MSQRHATVAIVCWFVVTGVLASLLASQQAWAWVLDRYYVCLDGRTTVWVSRSWNWPLSAMSAVVLFGVAWLMRKSSRHRARLGGSAALAWALLYVFLLGDKYMHCVLLQPLRPLVSISWLNHAAPAAKWWHQSEYMIRAAYDPTYVLAWLLGAVQAVLAILLVVREGFRYEDWECRRCGYNLTGNTSGVCPECGDGCDKRPYHHEQSSTCSNGRAEKRGIVVRVAVPVVFFATVAAVLPGWTGKHRLALSDRQITGPYEVTILAQGQKPLVLRVPVDSEAERMLGCGLGRSRDHWRLTFAKPPSDLVIAGSGMVFHVAGQKAFVLVAAPGEGAVRTYERTLSEDVVATIRRVASLLVVDNRG